MFANKVFNGVCAKTKLRTIDVQPIIKTQFTNHFQMVNKYAPVNFSDAIIRNIGIRYAEKPNPLFINIYDEIAPSEPFEFLISFVALIASSILKSSVILWSCPPWIMYDVKAKSRKTLIPPRISPMTTLKASLLIMVIGFFLLSASFMLFAVFLFFAIPVILLLVMQK